MSAFKSIVPIQQQQFNPVAGPVTGYITPVDMSGMEANSVIQLAKSLSDISPALRNLAGSYLKEDIAAAQQAGEAMDFTGVKLSASPEENEKQFRDFVQKNNAPLAANPYFLIAARSSYGRRMAQDYENEVRTQQDGLTAPFNPLNYDQVAQASRQKFIEQMGNNFYAVTAFNEAANQSDSRLRRYYFEEQSKKAEEFHKNQVSNEIGQLIAGYAQPGTDPTSAGKLTDILHREVTLKGLDPNEVLLKTVSGILQDPSRTVEDIDNIMVDLESTQVGKATVGQNPVLWGQLQSMATQAKIKTVGQRELELRQAKVEADRIATVEVPKLGWTDMLDQAVEAKAPGVADRAVKAMEDSGVAMSPGVRQQVLADLRTQELIAFRQNDERAMIGKRAVEDNSRKVLEDYSRLLSQDPTAELTPDQNSQLTATDRQRAREYRVSAASTQLQVETARGAVLRDGSRLGVQDRLSTSEDPNKLVQTSVDAIMALQKDQSPAMRSLVLVEVQKLADDATSRKQQAAAVQEAERVRKSADSLREIRDARFKNPSYTASSDQLAALSPADRDKYFNETSTNDSYSYFKEQVRREPLMVTLYSALGIDPGMPTSRADTDALNTEWANLMDSKRGQIMGEALKITNLEQRKDYIQQEVASAFESWKKSKIEDQQKQDLEAQRPTSLVSNAPQALMANTPTAEQGFAGQPEATQEVLKTVMAQGGKSRIPPEQYQTLVRKAVGQSFTQAYDTLGQLGFTQFRTQGRTLLRDPKELADFLADETKDFYEVRGKLFNTPMNKPQAMFLYSKIRTAFGYSYGDYEAKSQGKSDLYGMPFPAALSPFKTSMVSSAAELEKLKQSGFATAAKAFPNDIKTERDFREMVNYQEVLLDIQLSGLFPKDGSKPKVTEGSYGTGIPYLNW